MNSNGLYVPQNVYQQMGIPQPQAHLNRAPIKYSASNPPTSSFPNQQRPRIPQPQPQPQPQSQQPVFRPLPAPSVKPTPSRPLPTPGISSSPPKRRQSPPKFNPLPTPSVVSSSPPKPTDLPTPTDNKPTPPVWKRSIPQVPPPVWGYAAGLVADPHPKSSNQPPPPASVIVKTPSVPESPTKSTPNKLKKKTKTTEIKLQQEKNVNVNSKTKDQINALYGNSYVVGYSSRKQQAQYLPPSSRIHSIATSGFRSDEDDEEETEDAEAVSSEQTDEDEQEDDSDPAPFANGHRRYYSQPQTSGGMHRREHAYSDYQDEAEDEDEDEDEETPKKKNKNVSPPPVKVVLRPKPKMDPYGGYEDVSPIGQNARKVRPRSEFGPSHNESAFVVRKPKANEAASSSNKKPGHRRPRSAIEEREALILNARRRNRNRNREVESDYGAEEVHLAYDEEGEEEADELMNERRRTRGGQQDEFVYRPRSQPAALPRPPAMIRDHSQPERKILGGPRSVFAREEEVEVGSEGRRRNWPGDLPRLPRTPGGGGGPRNGYFDADSSDLNLDEPPPQASIIRTPSPGVAGGYLLQKREVESSQRRFNDAHQQQASQLGQGRPGVRMGGYPVPHHQSDQMPVLLRQQQSRGGPPPPPPLSSSSHFTQQARYTSATGTPSPRKQQQTPAPPPTIGIESPYPVGGRDRMADMNKLERGEREEEQQHQDAHAHGHGQMQMVQARRRNVNDNAHNNVNNVGEPRLPVVESGRRPLPLPSSPQILSGSRPQSMVIPPHGFGGGSPKKQQTQPSVPVIVQEEEEDAREPPPPSRSRSSADTKNSNSNSVEGLPSIQVFDVPGVYVSKPEFEDDIDRAGGGVMVSVSGPDEEHHHHHHHHHHQKKKQQNHRQTPQAPDSRYTPTATTTTPAAGPHAGGGGSNNNNGGRGGLMCGGCHGPITHGRILSAMGLRWHPACFKCTVCNTLLEHVSSFENDGKAFCHLDYHEAFAPRCYSCKTAIIDEQFISLDDPGLGKRTYHTQHFFCAECGDPFLDPSIPLSTDANGELALSGDGEFEGFTVYKGYPYCEACHVRLRLPKCKRCKKSIRDHEEAVEALGGKWCWACFVCAGCEAPFEDPSFFQRGNQPYCENCFSLMLRNEI